MADRRGNSVERYYASKQKRRKRKRVRTYAVLILLSLAIFVTLSLTVLFNIRTFEISGNAVYSREQILAAAGLEEGDNLFRLNKFKMEDALLRELPYIEQVEIYRRLPTTLCIDVVETKAQYVTYQEGRYVLLSDKLKVLGVTDALPEQLTMLIGDTVAEPTAGLDAVFSQNSETLLPELIALLGGEPWRGNVAAIDLSDRSALKLYYDGGRIKLLLGNGEYLREKMQIAAEAISQNSKTLPARIDINDAKTAYYRTLDEEELDDVTAIFHGQAKPHPDKLFETPTDASPPEEESS